MIEDSPRLRAAGYGLEDAVRQYLQVLQEVQEVCPHNRLVQIEVDRSGFSERICKHCGKMDSAYPEDGFAMTGVVEQLPYWEYVQVAKLRTDVWVAVRKGFDE